MYTVLDVCGGYVYMKGTAWTVRDHLFCFNAEGQKIDVGDTLLVGAIEKRARRVE